MRRLLISPLMALSYLYNVWELRGEDPLKRHFFLGHSSWGRVDFFSPIDHRRTLCSSCQSEENLRTRTLDSIRSRTLESKKGTHGRPKRLMTRCVLLCRCRADACKQRAPLRGYRLTPSTLLLEGCPGKRENGQPLKIMEWHSIVPSGEVHYLGPFVDPDTLREPLGSPFRTPRLSAASVRSSSSRQ